MMHPPALPADKLARRCNPAQFQFATPAETAKGRRAGAVLLPVADLARGEHKFEGLVDEIACPVVLIR